MCRGCGVEQTRLSCGPTWGSPPDQREPHTTGLGLLGGSASPWDGTLGLQSEAVLGRRGRDGVQGMCV